MKFVSWSTPMPLAIEPCMPVAAILESSNEILGTIWARLLDYAGLFNGANIITKYSLLKFSSELNTKAFVVEDRRWECPASAPCMTSPFPDNKNQQCLWLVFAPLLSCRGENLGRPELVLLKTCRQIYEEALLVLCHTNTWFFHRPAAYTQFSMCWLRYDNDSHRCSLWTPKHLELEMSLISCPSN